MIRNIKNYMRAHLPVLFLFVLTAMVFLLLEETQEKSSSPQMRVNIDNIVISHIGNGALVTLTARRIKSGEAGEFLLHDAYLHINESGRQMSLSSASGVVREGFSDLSFISVRGELRTEKTVLSLLMTAMVYDINQKTLRGENVSVINERYRLSADSMMSQKNNDLLLRGNVESVFYH